MIIHGFSKKEQLAKQLLDNGFYISFGKIIAQSRIGISFTSIPNNRFLETDTVEETIAKYIAAKYKNITVTEIQKEIKNNLAAVLKSNVEY
jgi:TatD DNase family protein